MGRNKLPLRHLISTTPFLVQLQGKTKLAALDFGRAWDQLGGRPYAYGDICLPLPLGRLSRNYLAQKIP